MRIKYNNFQLKVNIKMCFFENVIEKTKSEDIFKG